LAALRKSKNDILKIILLLLFPIFCFGQKDTLSEIKKFYSWQGPQ